MYLTLCYWDELGNLSLNGLIYVATDFILFYLKPRPRPGFVILIPTGFFQHGLDIRVEVFPDIHGDRFYFILVETCKRLLLGIKDVRDPEL